MANTKRRAEYVDRNGNMFMPMNVEGKNWEEHFINTPKFICIVLIIVSLVALIIYLGSIQARTFAYLFYIGIWAFISSLILRYIVFEEKFYYKMYKELKKHEISTPALFWNVASVKDTYEGAIIRYSDAKIAAILKVERDTITGKGEGFRETHYDAISDFYKELSAYKLNFIQMNIMEQAGKDPRLNDLGKLATKSDNANICKLMEMQIGHIKNITRITLYEMDYFLIYSNDPARVDTLIQDISDAVYKLLDGAYSGYRILTSKEIIDLVKEEYGVNYFNSTQASLYMFQRSAESLQPPFNINTIVWDDGVEQALTKQELQKLKRIVSLHVDGSNTSDIDLKKEIYRRVSDKKIGVNIKAIENRADEIAQRNNKRKKVKKTQNNAQQQTTIDETLVLNDTKLYGNDEIIEDTVNDDDFIDF